MRQRHHERNQQDEDHDGVRHLVPDAFDQIQHAGHPRFRGRPTLVSSGRRSASLARLRVPRIHRSQPSTSPLGARGRQATRVGRSSGAGTAPWGAPRSGSIHEAVQPWGRAWCAVKARTWTFRRSDRPLRPAHPATRSDGNHEIAWPSDRERGATRSTWKGPLAATRGAAAHPAAAPLWPSIELMTSPGEPRRTGGRRSWRRAPSPGRSCGPPWPPSGRPRSSPRGR